MTNWGMIILGVTVLAIICLYIYMEHDAENAGKSAEDADESPRE